jgi:uncharacterized protein YjbI with pentapeptide repeats
MLYRRKPILRAVESDPEIHQMILDHQLYFTSNQQAGKLADFSGMRIQDLDMSSLRLVGAKFNLSKLTNVKFKDAILNSADFDDSELIQVDFQDCNIQDVRFNRSFISRTNFIGAGGLGIKLQDAILKHCNGNGKEIVSLLINNYHVVLTENTVSINGDHFKSIDDFWLLDQKQYYNSSNKLEWLNFKRLIKEYQLVAFPNLMHNRTIGANNTIPTIPAIQNLELDLVQDEIL